MMRTAEHTETMECHTVIEIGDVININDLLFTKNRDYLIRYNDNQRVRFSFSIMNVCVISC